MPEFEEIIGNAGDKLKKLTKNKPALIAVAGVAGAAILVSFRKARAETVTTDQGVTYFTYPTTTGSAGATFQTDSVGDSLYYDLLEEMNNREEAYTDAINEQNSVFNDQSSVYADQFNEFESMISAMSERQTSLERASQENAAALNRNQKLAQMQANSDMYLLTNDQETRDRLHSANMAIAEELGLEYDNNGSYLDPSGDYAYRTPLQDYGRTPTNTAKSSTMVNNSTYEKAVASAASDTVNNSGSSSSKTVTADKDGNAPTGTKVGDVVKTKGGDYKVVEAGTKGASYNKSSGLWSVKI